MERHSPRRWKEVAEAIEAAAALTLAALAIALLPFRAVVRLMGRRIQGASSGSGEAVGRVRLAIRRARRRLPWRIVCFHEGLAAHWMLRRRGHPSVVHYGLRQSHARLSAHVWVTVDGAMVIGEEESDPHVCVAVFPQA